MISSEQCKWCDRDIFVLGRRTATSISVWCHAHTGAAACRATDLIEAEAQFTDEATRFRATPEDG